MGYNGYDDGGGLRVKHLAVMAFLLLAVATGYVGWRLSDDALTLLVGVVMGSLFIGLPGWVMAFIAMRSRELEMRDFAARMAEKQSGGPRPPLVLVQGGTAGQFPEQRGWDPPPQLRDNAAWPGTAYGEAYDQRAGPGEIREFGEL